MKALPSLSLVMPCYNDAATIEKAVTEAWEIGRNVAEKFEIVVANDASRDESGFILDKLKKKYKELRVISHTLNLGYGATIAELYYAARFAWLFSIPGDYQIGANELLKLLPEKDHADMILGWRVNRQDPPERLRQSKIYNTLLRWFFGLKLHDVNSVRLMPTHMFRNVRLTSASAFVDAELAIRLSKQGFAILEVPIAHRPDPSSLHSNGGGGSLKTILPTVKDLMRFWLTE